MEINRTYVWAHCESWIDGWNKRDLNKILSHYSDSFTFISPKIALFYPEKKDFTLHNKIQLHQYFSRAFQNLPDMKMEMVDLTFDPIGRTAVLDYWNHLTPAHSVRVLERMRFSRDGKIDNVLVCYGVEREGKTD